MPNFNTTKCKSTKPINAWTYKSGNWKICPRLLVWHDLCRVFCALCGKRMFAWLFRKRKEPLRPIVLRTACHALLTPTSLMFLKECQIGTDWNLHLIANIKVKSFSETSLSKTLSSQVLARFSVFRRLEHKKVSLIAPFA